MSIEALLRDGLPAKITITTGDDPNLRSLAGPLVIIYGGSGTPWNRRYGYTAQTRQHIWQVVCVSNTMSGSIAVAVAVADLLDGRQLDGAVRERAAWSHKMLGGVAGKTIGIAGMGGIGERSRGLRSASECASWP